MVKRLLAWRTKAGILQLTLGIALIMTMLCSAIIFLAYYNKLSILNQLISDQLRANSQSGIAYGLAMNDQLIYGRPYRVDFLCDETDSVTITRNPWGIFDRLTSIARHGERTASRSALITSGPTDITESAVYLATTNSPTYMVGDARIIGNAFIPEAGFSTGVIDGLGYKGNRFVSGEIRKSKGIPPLDTARLWLLKNLPVADGYKVQAQPGNFRRGYHSFDEPVSFYESADSIFISDTLSGNVIIRSLHKIVVKREAFLKDILLIAKDIEIEPGFKGRLQCFASRSITVHKSSELQYPSALVLMGHEQDSVISIRDSARVAGVVIVAGLDQTVGSPGYFKVHKKGFFHGVAYVNGAAEIEGELAGHLTLRAFQHHEGETVYGNYFVNGKVSSENRSEFMPASLLWEATEKFVIAQWLK